jgi:hypothetical protein
MVTIYKWRGYYPEELENDACYACNAIQNHVILIFILLCSGALPCLMRISRIMR